GLGHKNKIWKLRLYGWNGCLPEFRGRGGASAPKACPCVDENILEQKHRHVASHAVTLARQRAKQLDHGCLGSLPAIIDLDRIGPGGKITGLCVGPAQKSHNS